MHTGAGFITDWVCIVLLIVLLSPFLLTIWNANITTRKKIRLSLLSVLGLYVIEELIPHELISNIVYFVAEFAIFMTALIAFALFYIKAERKNTTVGINEEKQEKE